ncbi:zinc knuckle CX2CX4HX4C containing protein [Tanacetum coccineum]
METASQFTRDAITTTPVTGSGLYLMRRSLKVEFKRISLTGFRSCTSCSHYRSISKQTTRFIGYPFDYHVTLGFGSMAGGLDHVNPIIRLPLEHEISRKYGGSRHQYSHHGIILSIVTRKPEIRGNVNFEIKSQFMRELREDTFSGNKNEDAHDHVDRVLNIVSLFNIPGVSQDAVLLRVFPFTLTGSAKRWVDRLTPGAVNTWDLLKKAFIQRYCPPSKTAKRLEDIHNFKQESDESNISSNSDADGLAAVIRPHLDKECPLNEEVKQVDEVKYGEFGRPAPFNGSSGAKFRVGRLDFNNALADLGASINIMPFSMFKCLGIRKLKPINMVIEMADDTKCIPKRIVKNLLINIDKFILPIDFVILDMIEDFKMRVILGRPLLATAHAKVDIFQKTISLEVGNEKVIFKMRINLSNNINEYVRMVKTKMNAEDDELIKIESDLFTYNINSGKINHLLSIDPNVFTYDIEVQESYEEIVYKCSLIAQETNGELRFGEVSETARDKILQDHWRKRFENEYDDSEEFKDPDGCRESKENKILGTILNKLQDEWFKGTDEEDDDLE